MKQLGNRLRSLRESIGLSQAKFADVIGSTQSSINRYENGQATPTVELLRKYADCFDGLYLCPLRRTAGEAVSGKAPSC